MFLDSDYPPKPQVQIEGSMPPIPNSPSLGLRARNYLYLPLADALASSSVAALAPTSVHPSAQVPHSSTRKPDGLLARTLRQKKSGECPI